MISIQFDVVDLSFILFNEMSQAISVISRNGACYFLTHKTSGTCEDVLVQLHASNGKYWSGATWAVALDISKAFDRVWYVGQCCK